MNIEAMPDYSQAIKNQPELSPKDQEIIAQIESKLNYLKQNNPNAYQKLNKIIDISTLTALAHYPQEERLTHFQSIEEFLETEANQVDIKLKHFFLALLALILSLSFIPTTSYAKEKPAFLKPHTHLSKEKIKSPEQKPQFIANKEAHLRFGQDTVHLFWKNGKIFCLDQDQKSRIDKKYRVHSACGYAVSNETAKGGKITLLFWWSNWDEEYVKYRGRPAPYVGIFYQWDGKNFVPVDRNNTDHELKLDQSEQIIKELTDKNNQFHQYFKWLKEFVKNPPKEYRERVKRLKIPLSPFKIERHGNGYIYNDNGIHI